MNEFFYRYVAQFYQPSGTKSAVLEKVSLVVKTTTIIPNYKTSLMVKAYLADQLGQRVQILHMKHERLDMILKEQAELESVVPVADLQPLDINEVIAFNYL